MRVLVVDAPGWTGREVLAALQSADVEVKAELAAVDS
jgi:hypothetical protein